MTDLEKIKATDQWPFKLWLPMKKHLIPGEWPIHGFIMADNLGKIYKVAFYEWNEMSVEDRRKVEWQDYGSPEALVADGWLVD